MSIRTWELQPEKEYHTMEPDFVASNGWSLYFWRGLSRKWVLCRPDGLKVAMNDEIEPDNVLQAQEWANAIIDA